MATLSPTRLVLFLEPRGTGEVDEYGGRVPGPPVEHRVWCERQDGGGAEGYVADTVVGGLWERTYRCYADAFPAGRRPTERWTMEADDGAALNVREVSEEMSDTHPVVLRVRAYRTRSG